MKKITYNLFVRSENSTKVWEERVEYVSATETIAEHGKNLVNKWNDFNPKDPRVFVDAVLISEVNFHLWERTNLHGKTMHTYICLKCRCKGKAHILAQEVTIEYKKRKYANFCPNETL